MKDTTPASAPPECDHLLMIAPLLLLGIGLVMVFSSSGVLAVDRYQDPTFFLKKQLLYAVLGTGLMLFIRRIPYQLYNRLAYLILFISLFLLIIVLIPGVGVRIRSASRWLRLGPLVIQPSEFAKLAIIIFLAYSMARKQEKIRYFSIGFLPHIIIAGIFIVLIEKEPDFGTAMALAGITFLMLFVGGTRLTHIFLAVIAASPLVVYVILKNKMRLERMTTFIDPWKNPQEAGYQLVHSLQALGSGGFWGLGIGKSREKLFYLPDSHTDFIFSILAEEIGFLGVLIVICLFLIILMRGIAASLKAQDNFGAYLAIGLTALIGLQAAINMAVVSGILPTKGLSLPFLSYGGSSLIVNMVAIGILLNISSQGRGTKEALTRSPKGAIIPARGVQAGK
ncbi:putative lipid II flippase FtsW [Desulfobacca acetoxidans]|uniref:Probable peptidoglycan glycosyltransferase FtsW n=1 Tax=Desulfobacca acetoxidans (strain ATCC 700848 / DSM 11109 / ASRB2) TaxID=880072 RepID=F2NG71_DESAR|nr:putative lipid II flippase FtsW [Desulfobacca acetoxidans]AEB08484.1 cell division protein FtsW [Desulfobacca acetoxidans DSM 11109]HAY21752.1 putative lipid II flippase FtsW [Desulfobacterales bacterium]